MSTPSATPSAAAVRKRGVASSQVIPVKLVGGMASVCRTECIACDDADAWGTPWSVHYLAVFDASVSPMRLCGFVDRRLPTVNVVRAGTELSPMVDILRSRSRSRRSRSQPPATTTTTSSLDAYVFPVAAITQTVPTPTVDVSSCDPIDNNEAETEVEAEDKEMEVLSATFNGLVLSAEAGRTAAVEAVEAAARVWSQYHTAHHHERQAVVDATVQRLVGPTPTPHPAPTDIDMWHSGMSLLATELVAHGDAAVRRLFGRFVASVTTGALTSLVNAGRLTADVVATTPLPLAGGERHAAGGTRLVLRGAGALLLHGGVLLGGTSSTLARGGGIALPPGKAHVLLQAAQETALAAALRDGNHLLPLRPLHEATAPDPSDWMASDTAAADELRRWHRLGQTTVSRGQAKTRLLALASMQATDDDNDNGVRYCFVHPDGDEVGHDQHGSWKSQGRGHGRGHGRGRKSGHPFDDGPPEGMDIEDLASGHHPATPLCVRRLGDKMRRKGAYLHDRERLQWRMLCADLNYDVDAVVAHMHERFVDDGTMDERVWREKRYEEQVRDHFQRATAARAAGVETGWRSHSCRTLQTSTMFATADEDNDCAGCPYAVLTRDHLTGELQRLGGVNGDIAATLADDAVGVRTEFRGNTRAQRERRSNGLRAVCRRQFEAATGAGRRPLSDKIFSPIYHIAAASSRFS